MAATKKTFNQTRKEKQITVGRLEGNDAVLIDLGLFSYDTFEDKKINEELSKFLKSLGHPPAKIRLAK